MPIYHDSHFWSRNDLESKFPMTETILTLALLDEKKKQTLFGAQTKEKLYKLCYWQMSVKVIKMEIAILLNTSVFGNMIKEI